MNTHQLSDGRNRSDYKQEDEDENRRFKEPLKLSRLCVKSRSVSVQPDHTQQTIQLLQGSVHTTVESLVLFAGHWLHLVPQTGWWRHALSWSQWPELLNRLTNDGVGVRGCHCFVMNICLLAAVLLVTSSNRWITKKSFCRLHGGVDGTGCCFCYCPNLT
jgi:hypothetical protein